MEKTHCTGVFAFNYQTVSSSYINLILFSSCLILFFIIQPVRSSYNCRQQIIQRHDTIKRTCRQMCHEVVGLRDRKSQELGEPVTIDMLQQLYKSKSVQAESSKANSDFSDFFVASCVGIYDKLLMDAQCDAILDEMERKYHHGSCLNSVAKLKVILDKTECLESRRFVLAALLDHIQSGQLTNEQAWGGVNLITFTLSCQLSSSK